MRISELPKEIKELALLRQKERNKDLNTDDIANAFVWGNTPEGHYYWSKWNTKKTK